MDQIRNTIKYKLAPQMKLHSGPRVAKIKDPVGEIRWGFCFLTLFKTSWTRGMLPVQVGDHGKSSYCDILFMRPAFCGLKTGQEDPIGNSRLWPATT